MKQTLAIALGAFLALTACQKENDKPKDSEGETADKGNKAGAGRTMGERTKPSHGGMTAPEPIPAPSDVAAPPADAQKTASGLAYKVLKQGAGGPKPVAADKVKVHYTGWTTDGKMFDSSVARKRPSSFKLTQVIAGWTEGLQLMSKGDSYRLWIPEKLAYQGRPGKPAGMLVFDVELLDIIAAPKAPDDVAKPPANAKKTPKGVFYKVLTKGAGSDGATKPRAWDKVKVHYTGWTTDGKMFDSSITRGRPASFNVSGVIPGWTDALQQMIVGDKWRVWIPKQLAYDGKPGRPQGMLVFDVELLAIERLPEPPPPPETPKDVKAPPAGAKKTPGGVSYVILKKGDGGAKPKPTSNVTVHYSGWTTDGKLFDSSVVRNKPATFNLSRVVPGWSEGLQQMTTGAKARIWIPEELAYKGRKGAPQGMLVFDVELIKFQ